MGSLQLAPTLSGVIAALLMVVAGLNVKHLRRRAERCPVCGRTSCTCRLRL